MLIFLGILLALALAFFVFVLIADASRSRDEPSDARSSGALKGTERKQGTRALDAELLRYKKRCFETYRDYQIAEQKYRLYRQVFCSAGGELGVFHYLQELFSFYKESLNRKMKGSEYKSRVLDGILTPMREHIHKSFPYKDAGYHVSEQFDMFLTPEEYYEQQLSYRTQPFESADVELSFWRGRLSRNDENLKKLQTESGNAFFLKLWLSLAPLLEEAELRYREALRNASGREGANELTKTLTEKLEEALFRCGVLVLRFENAADAERKVAFVTASEPEAPAIVREKDSLVYEKGRTSRSLSR